MDKIRINFKNPRPEDISLIANYLKNGKIIAYPTDTVYGLGCSALNKEAILNVFKIKKRSKIKALLVLVANFEMLKKYFFVSNEAKRYLQGIWPGPVSVLLKKKSMLPDSLAPGKGKIAVRLPKSDFLVKLVKKSGFPLVSTSLNLSGAKTLESVAGLDKIFEGKLPDLAVDIGGKLEGKPSRLIDIEDINNIKILRK